MGYIRHQSMVSVFDDIASSMENVNTQLLLFQRVNHAAIVPNDINIF
jgi:hypothetical protein